MCQTVIFAKNTIVCETVKEQKKNIAEFRTIEK